MDRESVKQQLKDVVHEHHQPLVFNEEPWDESKETPCSACKDLLSGESYSCAECEFHLHKRCAEAPSEINHLHRKHQLLTLQASTTDSPDWGRAHYCDICLKQDVRFCYGCSSCEKFIDIKCALFTLNHSVEILHPDSHKHPLLLIENSGNKLERRSCIYCLLPLLDSAYVCTTCSFCVHKSCSELTNEIISHPCHRFHSLRLNRNEKSTLFWCDLCCKLGSGYFYSCDDCDLRFHLGCLRLGPMTEAPLCEHPLNLLWRTQPFICDLCCLEGKYVSYVCFTCHIQAHKHCISPAPRIVTSCHRHLLCLNYRYDYGNEPIVEHKEVDFCAVCYDEIKRMEISYRCKACMFLVHLKCAGYYDIYEDFSENPLDSSITCVIEKNRFGEAVKLKHFSHKHDLMLQKETEEVIDKQCDGCMELISVPFYYCSQSQCNFLLHKSCAEFPRIWSGWLVPFFFTLKSGGIFKCKYCLQQCSGFSYNYYRGEDEDKIVLCLPCARIPDKARYLPEEDLRLFVANYDGKCTACGQYDHSKFGCLTLPAEARHKCDKHVLRLEHKDEIDHPAHNQCDICEETRDPIHWFYYCSSCDNSAHPKCVLGDYPFIKIGSTYTHKAHHHPLTFVRKIYHYPKCEECKGYCLDLSLECAECEYIVHWKCISPFNSVKSLLCKD